MADRNRKSGSQKNRARTRLVVRRARPEDRDRILDMSKEIWGGHDYLPQVWDNWVSDTEGVLLTVLYDGEPVGTTKISVLSPGEVWLEGLRLHPKLHGRGLSRQIHDATFQHAMGLEPRSVRYSTWIGNEASRHIAETNGFWEVARGVWMWGKVRRRKLRSRRAAPDDTDALTSFVRRSECYEKTGGLMGVGWKYPELTRRRLSRLVAEGNALVYPARGEISSVALVDVEMVDGDLCLGFLDGPDAEIETLARDVLAVAGEDGRDEVSAMLPVGRIADAALRSGFDTEPPTHSVVYELGARGVTGQGESFEELVARSFRMNESAIVEAAADIIVESTGTRLNRQNVRDYLQREPMPDTTRALTGELLRMSNRLRLGSVRLVLRSLVMHLHSEHGLSGDAMTIRKRSISVSHMNRRLAGIRCSRNSIALKLGPGFGPCFPRDLSLDVEGVRFDDRWRDAETGDYEAVELVLTDKKHLKGAIKAIDMIMSSASRAG